MKERFLLEIITPERIVVKDEVEEVYAPGFLGEFGVLAGHCPYLVNLSIGELKIVREGKTSHFALSGGIAEVDYNAVRILAETAELAEEIDVERAERAKERALEKLKELHPIEHPDEFTRTQLALQRALVRLQVARKAHSG